MNSRCRLQLLPFLALACISWSGLCGAPAAFGSCGDYLHSRLGPPKQTTRAVVRADFTFPDHGGVSWKFSGSLPLKPCSGPHCGRSSVPPLLPPASLPSNSRGWDDYAFSATAALSAAPTPGYAPPQLRPLLSMADLAPLDTPPDC